MSELNNLVTVNFQSRNFYFHRTPTAQLLVDEIFSDNYHIFRSHLQFIPGDIIIDLGANEGMFSIMMAKIFPSVRIIAVEPVSRTYKQLLDNISLNHIENIFTIPVGIGSKYESREIIISKEMSGGSSTLINFKESDHIKENIRIVTLEEIFGEYEIKKCKLLKIDIEGMEHEVLWNTTVLPMVENLVGEFHINDRLQKEKCSIGLLVDHVKSKTNLIHYEYCRMAD
jgi:FkbM family methyltransferase